MNSIRILQETHATHLPEVNRISGQSYMDRLVFNSPKFAPCFEGKKDLGPQCGVCSKTSGKSALVVMDMQDGFFRRNGAIRKPANRLIVDKVIEEQIKAIKQAKANDLPIMIVEHDINASIPYFPDKTWRLIRVRTETDPRIMEAVDGYDKIEVIKKNTDSFLDHKNSNRKEVVDFFRKNKVQQIIMTGVNGGACVSKSIANALGKGCEVVSYSKGIADFNFDAFVYPYSGRYDSYMMEVNGGACRGCVFREIHTLGSLTNLMRLPSKSTNFGPEENQGIVQ